MQTCAKCGAPLSLGATDCAVCGFPVNGEEAQGELVNAGRSTLSAVVRLLLILVLGPLLLLLLIATLMFSGPAGLLVFMTQIALIAGAIWVLWMALSNVFGAWKKPD